LKTITPPDGRVKDAIEYPLIPPGDYDAIYRKHALFTMYGGAQKLRTFFTVSDAGEAFGLSIPWFCNIKITSKKNRTWTAGTRTRLIRTLCRLLPDYHPNKQKRIPMDRLKQKAFRIRVTTVTTDRKGDLLPEQLYYSKVDEILELL
jgi:hypothetical protein